MIKRFFDLVMSLLGLLLLSPVFLIIAVFILLDSRGGVFYKQMRVGRGGMDFNLFKFRSMKTHSDLKGALTIGANDSRITRVGFYIRKYKLDELPQLLNVFIGNMSLVGPRPEVRKYVQLYNKEQLEVLTVKPGITDYASIVFSNESELLGKNDDPEKVYIDQIMPQKLRLNLKYIREKGMIKDIRIILGTLSKITGLGR